MRTSLIKHKCPIPPWKNVKCYLILCAGPACLYTTTHHCNTSLAQLAADLKYSGMLRDKTMKDKLFYVPQNYSFCWLNFLVKSFDIASLNQIIKIKQTSPKPTNERTYLGYSITQFQYPLPYFMCLIYLTGKKFFNVGISIAPLGYVVSIHFRASSKIYT